MWKPLGVSRTAAAHVLCYGMSRSRRVPGKYESGMYSLGYRFISLLGGNHIKVITGTLNTMAVAS